MDPSALAKAMAEEFVASVPLKGDDDEWLAAARRIIASSIRDDGDDRAGDATETPND